MFTGLVEEVGAVRSLRASAQSAELLIRAPQLSKDLRAGDSIAVNGCCLTITEIDRAEIHFDLLAETLRRSNLHELRVESPVNLERALSAAGRLGGHFVQGHVDCTARTQSFTEHGAEHRLEIELPNEYARYLIDKGSIAINGVSLTIAELLPASFVVWIIPHTLRSTNLGQLHSGALVNLEFDLLAKYVERMLEPLAREKFPAAFTSRPSQESPPESSATES